MFNETDWERRNDFSLAAKASISCGPGASLILRIPPRPWFNDDGTFVGPFPSCREWAYQRTATGHYVLTFTVG